MNSNKIYFCRWLFLSTCFWPVSQHSQQSWAGNEELIKVFNTSLLITYRVINYKTHFRGNCFYFKIRVCSCLQSYVFLDIFIFSPSAACHHPPPASVSQVLISEFWLLSSYLWRSKLLELRRNSKSKLLLTDNHC